MAPKNKKNKKYLVFNSVNVQEIESKCKETPTKTEKTKKSQKGQGNPREKNTFNNTEDIKDKDSALTTNENEQDIRQQNVQESSSSCLEIAGHNLKSQFQGKPTETLNTGIYAPCHSKLQTNIFGNV